MPVRELKLSLDLSALRSALDLTEEQLPDDATDEQVNEALLASKASGGSKPDEKKDKGGDALVPKQDKKEEPDPTRAATPPRQVPGGIVVDTAMWAETQQELAAVRADREARELKDDQEFVKGAVRKGKFPAARADHYMTLMKADREGTRKFIEDLPEGLPVTEMGNLGTLEDALKASDYPETWLNPAERRRIKAAQAAYAEGSIADVEPGAIIREA
jgi:hypothetical protein